MKKKKILSAFAALAVAVCSVVTPLSKETDLSLTAAGATTILTTGGISAEGVSGSDITALEKGQQVKIKLTIPKIPDALDTIKVSILFDQTAFQYASGDWTVNGIVGKFGSSGITANDNVQAYADNTNGKLSFGISAPGTVADPYKIKMDDEITLEAIMNVTSKVGTDYTFSIDKTDGNFQCCYMSGDDYGDFENVTWNPEKDKQKVHIANTFGGTIEGFDFTSGPLTVSIVDSSGNVATIGDDNIPLTQTIAQGSTSGDFEFKSMPETGTYYLQLDSWCVFTEFVSGGTNPDGSVQSDKIECSYTINSDMTVKSSAKIPGSTEIRKNAGTFKVRMFGDVDGNSKIEPADATLILKHVVGSAVIDDSTDEGKLKLAMGNVLQDKSINAKDSTQVLRKYVGLPNTFSRHTKND